MLGLIEEYARLNKKAPRKKKRDRYDLTQEELKDILDYKPETGEFTWLSSAPSNLVGRAAGTWQSQREKRKLLICIAGYKYFAHHLAFFYMNGKWADHPDFVDGDTTNLKWSNLTDKVAGIAETPYGRFKATLHYGNKKYYLGTYKTYSEALRKLKTAKKKREESGSV